MSASWEVAYKSSCQGQKALRGTTDVKYFLTPLQFTVSFYWYMVIIYVCANQLALKLEPCSSRGRVISAALMTLKVDHVSPFGENKRLEIPC